MMYLIPELFSAELNFKYNNLLILSILYKPKKKKKAAITETSIGKNNFVEL